MISIRFIGLIALIAMLVMPVFADGPNPCGDKEMWFETGIGYYSEGYDLKESEKRARMLHRMSEGESLTEDEAVAVTLQAWRLLDGENASKNINQIQRIGLAQLYYAQCLKEN